ncbi:MAG: hypothetical protein VKL59_10020 [Nostocaceae cyanobacterium]|nr:hypothetical protein [Nostocaceae cyanobacterium]
MFILFNLEGFTHAIAHATECLLHPASTSSFTHTLRLASHPPGGDKQYYFNAHKPHLSDFCREQEKQALVVDCGQQAIAAVLSLGFYTKLRSEVVL